MRTTKDIIEGNFTVWDAIASSDFTHFSHLFQFIQWEDDEPYNIKELLE